ncbi:hypothetical protein DPMN_179303 [Dreissena polymorpha]|uniref:Uncharacterized protein n=1 Tax=Dreissena polymorpha TaxID=45954 RepID=A0A9D4EGR9_DREPO|nr:hypothetical protein DPMN_179303 [Dreissena polymorpha]
MWCLCGRSKEGSHSGDRNHDFPVARHTPYRLPHSNQGYVEELYFTVSGQCYNLEKDSVPGVSIDLCPGCQLLWSVTWPAWIPWSLCWSEKTVRLSKTY